MTLQTLNSSIKVFLNQPHLKPSTVKAYKQVLSQLVAYLGTDRPLSDIHPMDIQRFWSRLSQRDYSPYTLRKHLRSIRAYFNWCIAMQIIDRSPAVNLKHPRVSDHISRNKAMTEQEYESLLAYASKTSPRNYALLLFLGDTGCRAIAASRLRRSDLDLDDYSATVTGKGDRTRTVYYGDRCRSALIEWLRHKPLNTSDYVFRSRGHGAIKPDNISQIIRRMAEKVGLDRTLGSHSLRHRKGHQLADRGTPITVSAKALGHVNTQTTQGYYPDDDERVRRAMDDVSTSEPKPPDKKIIHLRKRRP